MRRLEAALAWLAAVLAAGACALGLVGPHLGADPGLPGVVGFSVDAIAALWLHGGVLALVCALVALLRGRRWPAAILAVVAVTIVGPDVWARIRAPSIMRARAAPPLRIAAANLAEQNEDDPLMLDALLGLDADVLVLPEYTPSWERRLGDALRARYAHFFLASPPPQQGNVNVDGFRLAVWSRLPPAGEPEVIQLAGVVAQIRVPLRWQGRDFALYGIHPRKPFPLPFFRGAHRDRAELLAWLSHEPLPMVIAGDFNATPRGAFLTRLRGRGLANAAEAVLGTSPATWPMYPALLAPFRVAIDHVLHSDAFAAVSFRTGDATRSDHAAIVAELVWR